MGVILSKAKIKRLMIPGPTEISKDASDCLALPIQPHYGDEWVKIYKDTLKKLKKIFVTSNDIVIFAGTASAAIESAISSTLQPGDKVLVCHNGLFSERVIEIIKSWGGNPVIVESKLNQAINPKTVSIELERDKKIKMVAIVHVETSTGVENPVKEVCRIARENNIITLVDSVAGLGGCEIPVDNWKIDLVITGSQKCLESPTGLSFLSISKKAWRLINQKNTIIGGWYLNLKNIKAYQEKWAHWHLHGPNSAPVSLYMALNCSIDKILHEGLNERIKRHENTSIRIRRTLEILGLKLFVDDRFACKTLTSFLLPKNINPSDFLNLMRDEHNTILAGDVGYVNKQLIRFGHLGRSASDDYLSPTFDALENSLGRLGFQFKNKGATNIFSGLK